MNRYAAVFFARVSLTDFAENPVIIVRCDCDPPPMFAARPSNFRRHCARTAVVRVKCFDHTGDGGSGG